MDAAADKQGAVAAGTDKELVFCIGIAFDDGNIKKRSKQVVRLIKFKGDLIITAFVVAVGYLIMLRDRYKSRLTSS